MQKRILGLILVLALIPTAFFFAACGKGTKNNLSTLDDEFYAIATNYDNFVFNNDLLQISLANHDKLATVVNSSNNQYRYIKNYNSMFESLMCFSSEYIDECANFKQGVDKDTKKRIFNDLHALKLEVNAVDRAIETLSGKMAVNSSTSSDCLTAYENLLLTYEDMFEKAIIFNNTIVDLYYNRVLRSGNPNIAAMDIDDFNVEIVINKLYGRVCYQRANLTQSYVKMYIEGGNLAHKLAYGEISLDTSKYNYANNMASIGYTINIDQAIEKANVNKLSFYNFAVQAYNLQEILSMDIGRLSYACRTICMARINANSSPIEKVSANIIKENYNTLSQYNAALAGMINIIK